LENLQFWIFFDYFLKKYLLIELFEKANFIYKLMKKEQIWSQDVSAAWYFGSTVEATYCDRFLIRHF